jgi:hypothetical protein
LGLTLAHQDLEQLKRRDPELLSAVLTNPATRVCFRVGDLDARKLAEGFSAFGPEDLQKLGVGEAVCRVERADWDFNLRTLPLPAVDPEEARGRRDKAAAISRERYARPRAEIEDALRAERPQAEPAAERVREAPLPPAKATKAAPASQEPSGARSRPEEAQEAPESPKRAPKLKKRKPAAPSPAGRGGPQHTYLQELVRRWAAAHEWRAEVEKAVLDGLGAVDVALSKGEASVACEITVGSTPEQELAHVQKCLAAGFDHVAVVSAEKKTLRKAKKHIAPKLEEAQRSRVRFLTPEQLFTFLEEREAELGTTEDTVRGYKVKTRYRALDKKEHEERRKAISKVILESVRRLEEK